MTLSSLEIRAVVSKLGPRLPGYYISNVYSVDGETALLKLHKSEAPEIELVISPGRGLWPTEYQFERVESTALVVLLRRQLERGRFVRIEQPEDERVVSLDFETPNGIRRLIGEFFGAGNIVLTLENGTILGSLRELQFRHRRIARGETYRLPPSRGKPLGSLLLEDLLPLQDSKETAMKWLMRSVSVSKEAGGEALKRAGISPSMISPDRESVGRLQTSLRELYDYAGSPDAEGIVVFEAGQPTALLLASMSPPEGTSVQLEPFMRAVDRVLTGELLRVRDEGGRVEAKKELAELEESIKKQRESHVILAGRATILRKVAESMAREFRAMGIEGLNVDLINSALAEHGGAAETLGGEIVLKLGDWSESVQSGTSVMKFSSILYDHAKQMESKMASIEPAMQRLEARANQLRQDLIPSGKAETGPAPSKGREKAWYESYRWFLSSDGLLAVGGRDATTNSRLITRYSEDDDLVFHTEHPGSPFFILKKGAETHPESLREVAEATASFSRAWKDGYSVSDAYWVFRDQLELAAPSGEYLPKGSFMIRGTRNYLRGLKTALAIGFVFEDDFPVVFGGPPSAVRKNSHAYVEVQPGREKPSDLAKKIKSEFVRLVDQDKARTLKRMNLDEILRSLPSGGGVIRASGRGERKPL